jgi:hypothetical protein
VNVAKKAKAGKKRAVKKSVSKPRPKPKAKKAAAKKKATTTRAARVKNAARAAAGRTKESPRKHAQKERAEFRKTSKIGSVARIAAGAALLAVDAVTSRLPWAKNENDPIELLKTDHRHFEKLLKEGEATTERAKKGRREVLAALTADLTVHEAIEEKVFYPALRPHADAHDLVLESYQEHHVADGVMQELHDVSTDDEQWGAKFKVLKENLEHHISEEENKLFPIARGVLQKDELLQLGAKMRDLKAELEK